MGEPRGNQMLLFDTSDFPRRWQCGTWTDLHGWIHIVSDLAVFGAYMAIPIALFYFLRKRPDVPFPKIFWLFGAFILACGTVHLIEAMIFWWPVYRVSATFKAATAVVSWGTVAALIPILPKALALPGLARLNEDLERRVAERTDRAVAMAEAARLAQGRAEEAEAQVRRHNEELETLLHVASHDLREPLRAVSMFSEKLDRDYADELDDKGRDMLRRMGKGVARLDRLLSEVLALSRVQRMDEPVGSVDARVVVDDALEQLSEAVRARGATIEVADGLPEIHADRRWAAQAVYNLVANALKFVKDGEAPMISIAPYTPRDGEPGGAGLVVADRGPGVDPEQAERVFGLFRRAVGRDVEGTGAGLAIVRQIAQRHGGSAWVRPREGGGAEFVLTFGGGGGARV